MPIIQKDTFKQNLDQVSVLIKDTDPNSLYFKITNLPDTLTGGKNAFLIQGSPQLVADTLVKIEIKDSFGNPIYTEPAAGIPEYYEGTSKVVAVHIYPSTGFGPATITILGELSHFLDGELNVPIPTGWKDKYNVKWQKTINVNPFLQNTTPIRFYRRPKIEIVESVLPIYNRNVVTNTSYGKVSGVAINPIQDSDWKSFKGNLIYQLSTPSPFFSQSMEGRQIKIDGLLTTYSPTITDVTTNTTALVNFPYYITSSASPYFQQIKSFTNADITASFEEAANLTISNINTSFARIKVTDLETFTGDAARIKVYASSRNDLGDYELLEDTLLESNEILKVDEFNGQLNVRTGIFTQPTLDTFWKIENIKGTGSAQIDNELLLHSAKLEPSIDATNSLTADPKFKFYTSASINFTKFTQYQLDFTPIMSSSLGYSLLEVYLSGSAFVPTDNNTKFGKLIAEYESNYPFRKYDKQQINFQPDSDGTGKLVFLIKGGKWHIGNVSLRAAQETSFSPNEIDLVVNVPVKINNETFDFKFEIYDINNNYVPIDLVSSATFVGGNDVSVNRDLQIETSNQYFNFSTDAQFPSFITIDWTKTGLTGSVEFASSAFDNFGNYIEPQTNYPGLLTYVDDNTKTLSIESFTSSLSLAGGAYVGAITYTASCEDINRYFTIFRIDQGAPSYLFYATADKNTFIFNPDDNDKSVIVDDFIDIRLVRQNLPAEDGTGLVINKTAEFGIPPSLTNIGTINNYTTYRVYVTSSTHPSSVDGYYYALGQSTYDFELHTIDGIFTSSITIDAIAQGSASKALTATSDLNQFVYRNSDLAPVPTSQTATILVKRQNLSSSNAPITVTKTGNGPNLTLVSNEYTNGVAQYTVSTPTYGYTSGSTTYVFSANDKNGNAYTDDITINTVLIQDPIAASFSNENVSLTAYSTGFVKSSSFAATSGSISVTAGTQNISYSNPIQNNTFSASIASTTGATATTVSGSYSVSNMTQDSASVNLNVTYQSGTGTQTVIAKTVTLSKAKVSPPTVTMAITNANQSIQANSKGAIAAGTTFTNAVLTVTENYNNATTNLSASVSFTYSAGYTGPATVSYSGGSSTIGIPVLSTGVDSATITTTAIVTDSEGVQRTLTGTINLTKVRSSPPLVSISVAPLTQTVATNSRGSGSTAPNPVQIYADDNGVAKSVSAAVTPYGTNGLVPSFAAGTPGTLTFNTPSSWWADSVGYGVTVAITDSEGTVVNKFISGSISKAKAAVPVTTISANPQSQTVTYDGSTTPATFGTPSTITLSINEGAGNYSYSATMDANTAINTYTITAVTNGTNNSGVITPTAPSSTLGINGTATISYKNSEGTIVTGKTITFNVGVSLKGTTGATGDAGPGVVFRGTYASSTIYLHTSIRRDVVKGSNGTFYVVNNTAKSGLGTWGDPAAGSTDWTAFGASFSSVATDILLAGNATISEGLVIGTIGNRNGFIRSDGVSDSNASGDGFFINNAGTFRVGNLAGDKLVYDTTNGLFIGNGTSGFKVGSSAIHNPSTRNTYANVDPTGIYLGTDGITLGDTFRVSSGGDVVAGSMILSGSLSLNNRGKIYSSGKSTYGSDATAGFFLGYDTDNFKLNIGSDTAWVKWTGNSLDIKGDLTTTSGTGVQTYFTSNDTNITNINNNITTVTNSVTTVDNKVFTDASGKIIKTAAPAGTGLFNDQTKFGFYNGGWKTYMDNTGAFYLAGYTGTGGLTWAPGTATTSGTLTVDGVIIGRSGQFSGTVTSGDGSIGGWTIGPTTLKAGSGTVVLDSGGSVTILNGNAPSIYISNKATLTPVATPAAPQTTGTVAAAAASGVTLSTTVSNNTAKSFTLTPGKTYTFAVSGFTSSGTAASVSSGVYRIQYSARVYLVGSNTGTQVTLSNSSYTAYYNTTTGVLVTAVAFGGGDTQTVTYTPGAEGTTNVWNIWRDVYVTVGAQTQPSTVTANHIGFSATATEQGSNGVPFTEIITGGIQVYNSSTQLVKINTAAGVALQVIGEITATGNITAYAASDRRLKENIKPITSALKKLNKITGVEFDWKESYVKKVTGGKSYDDLFYRKHDIGIIAQEVKKVLPEVVGKRHDKYLAVRYEKIVPVLIEAIKELKKEIDELKNQIGK